jgi:hypothetical protein
MYRLIRIASCVALTTVAGLLSAAMVHGQGKPKDTEEVGVLQFKQLRGAEQARFSDIRAGREKLNERDDRAILEEAAKYYVNRLTHPLYRKGSTETGSGSRMNDIVKDAIRQVPAYDPKKPLEPNQKEFVQVFDKYLVAQVDKVLATPWPITHINAAMILDHIAKTGYEEVADTLIKVIEDPKENDGTRVYALRGLKDLFALQHMQPPVPIKDKKREARCISVLIKFLNRTAELGDDPSDPEIDGFRWVRREAVMALAMTRHPWMLDPERKPMVESPTAWELLRVCCKNDLNPEPSVKEQIEAAIGVCQLKARDTPGYQIDYAAHYLGWFLRDFTLQYLAKDPRNAVAWKYQAARLQQALLTLKEDAKTVAREDRAAADYVNSIVAKFEPVLQGVEKQESPDTSDLKTWLQKPQNAPPGKSLFKNQPDKYQLKPPSEPGR